MDHITLIIAITFAIGILCVAIFAYKAGTKHILGKAKEFAPSNARFEVDKELEEWIREHVGKCRSRAFDGAQFKYEFIPTAIVEVQTVKCMCCKKEKTVYID